MAAPFHRILALSPHACEMLYAIGAAANTVGAVSYCDYPDQAKDLPRVGNYQAINIEAALRLNPDAAVVLSRNLKGIQQLESMGVHIIVSNPSSFESIFQDLLTLGELTDHRQQAMLLVGQQRLRLAQVKAKKATHIRVFYEIWHNPLLAAGGSSFLDALIHDAGGDNIFAQVALEAPRVNIEAIVRAKPDVIIMSENQHDLQARQVFWEKWLGKGQVRIITVPADLMHRPGPRLIEGLELLQRLLRE